VKELSGRDFENKRQDNPDTGDKSQEVSQTNQLDRIGAAHLFQYLLLWLKRGVNNREDREESIAGDVDDPQLDPVEGPGNIEEPQLQSGH